MKTMILAFLGLFSGLAMAAETYTPSIKCSIEGFQKTELGESRYKADNIMYWDSRAPAQYVLGLAVQRLNNSPDEFRFRISDKDSSIEMSVNKGRSVEWSWNTGSTSSTIKFSCQ